MVTKVNERPTESRNRRLRLAPLAATVLLSAILVYFFSPLLLKALGNFIVRDERPVRSDAIVVLNSGVEYFPRLIEAASLYQHGIARTIVINGNRKTDALRDLEKKGFEACCPWYENSLRILSLYRIPRSRVIELSAEDAYDTISEAQTVGKELLARGMKNIIVTTSKYHTRRAAHVWKTLFKDRLTVHTVAAKTDPFDPDGWWKQGRQIRWVLAEYGAWVFYLLQTTTKDSS